MTDRATLFARLARLTVTTPTGGDLARRLGAASQSILHAEGMAITVENATDNRVTLCATDPVMSRLEDLQDVIGEGPCLDAFRHSTYFTATISGQPDLRWPEFSRAAWQAVGGVQMYCFPMRPGGRTVGAASVYLTGDRELAETIDNAQFIIDAVGAALVTDPAVESDDGEWSARAPVHQATGMVAAQLDLPADDALALLRAHAYATNDTLAGAARQVIEREVDFRTEP